MLNFVICAITNLFRIYLTYKFAEIFLGKTDKPKRLLFLVGALFYVSNLALYWGFHTAWINVLSNLAGVFAVVCLYTKSIKTNLFITISITLINIGCDVFATLPYVQYEDGQTFNQIYEVLTDLYLCVCLLLLGKIITTRKNANEFFKISLISVPLCSIALITFFIYSEECGDFCVAVVGIGLLIINFFMFKLYDQLLQSMSRQLEAELLEQKNQIYVNQLKTIMQSEEKINALRHDMKHHVNELMILANGGKSKEIAAYLTRMTEALQNPDEIVSSGNLEIDSVLNYLLQQAKEKLTTVNVKVTLPEELKHTFDAIVLLGNLLENAIEAASQTERKYLSVNISLNKGVLLVRIDNSFLSDKEAQKNLEDKKSLLILKKKEHHGLGLKNVQRIVDAHNGTMEIIKENDLYSVRVLLYLSRVF